MKYLLQAVAFAAFAAFVGLLSVWPSYSMLAPQEAILSLSFSHAGQRIGECRRLTQEELDELPPNMRKPADCPRERHPIQVSLIVDGRTLYAETVLPSGLWQDGKSNVYERLKIQSGTHNLRVAMNDSGSTAKADYEKTLQLDISPAQNVLISFDGLNGEFTVNQVEP